MTSPALGAESGHNAAKFNVLELQSRRLGRQSTDTRWGQGIASRP